MSLPRLIALFPILALPLFLPSCAGPKSASSNDLADIGMPTASRADQPPADAVPLPPEGFFARLTRPSDHPAPTPHSTGASFRGKPVVTKGSKTKTPPVNSKSKNGKKISPTTTKGKTPSSVKGKPADKSKTTGKPKSSTEKGKSSDKPKSSTDKSKATDKSKTTTKPKSSTDKSKTTDKDKKKSKS